VARRLILDTAVLIEAERQKVDLDTVIADEDDIVIAAITVAELLVGVELADNVRRPGRAAFATDVLTSIPVADYTEATASQHALLLAATRKEGRPRGAHDLIIAATALTEERTLVSFDAQANFAGLPGVRLLVPPRP
jgi:tRNA(fMet)-specific endonuclease VapC